MDFNVFTDNIVNVLQQRMGHEYDVKVTKVTKNNDIELTGVVLMKESDNLSPTIYLDGLFEEYQDGAYIEDLAEQIIRLYKEQLPAGRLDMDFFRNFEQVKDRIFYKLVSYDKNRKMLEKLPYYKWNDLAIIFYYAMEEERIGRASITIHHQHLKMWEQSLDTLYAVAQENMKKSMPELLVSMKDLLEETTGLKMGEDTYLPMYVLTNQEKVYGAAAMLYSEHMKKLAERWQTDLLILPSSIHEVLLLPDDGQNEYAFYRQMVEEVNTTQVEPEEVLSYSLYRYCREKAEIEEILS
ncbi:MAG: DUF5688 family protein [Lachnospiraceae bacterium]|nr:DUF5688 family protein [Lachnospiraceae bacterium]